MAIIFDLDNCLSAADEPGRELLEPMFAAIRQANGGSVSEDKLQRAFEDCWRHPLDWVAKEYGFSEAMTEAGWAIAKQIEVASPMRGYADIQELAALGTMLFLVTSGFRRLQKSKIRALGFANRFKAIYVDAIDEPDRRGKERIFREILADYNLLPGDALVVGDSAESEIEAGNRLGIPTAQILREGVPRANNATYYIRTLSELKEILKSHA